MDVIGNNIANANANGFKTSRVNFSDVFSNSLSEATAPTTTSGGTGPQQIGQGVTLGSVIRDFSQGALKQSCRA